jgi:hypothetical protein
MPVHREDDKKAADVRMREKLEEQRQSRKRLLDSIGFSASDGTNPFTGTAPLHESAGGQVVAGTNTTVPLPTAGIDPSDPGVNVGALLGSMKFNIGNKKKAKLGE